MHRLTRVLLVLVLAFLLAVPFSASAAEKPRPWQALDVLVHTEDGETLLIASGELPPTTKLPAPVLIAVPAGSQLRWAGEILGGDVSADPSVNYTVKTEGDSDLYSFTLTKSRIGQIEVVRPDLIVVEAGANKAQLGYTPATDVGELRLKYRLPQSAKVEQAAEGAAMEAGPSGYSYYGRKIAGAKAGEAYSLAFTFSGSAAAPAAGSSGQTTNAPGSNNFVLALLLGVSALGLGLLGRGFYMKLQSKQAAVPPAPRKPSHEPKPAAARKRNPGQSEAEWSEAEEERAAASGSGQKRPFVVALVVVALVAGALAAVNASRGGVSTGDTVEIQYAQVDTCTTSNIALTPPDGASLEADKNKVTESLRSVAGVGNATLHLKESRIEVRYCDSSVQEPQVLEALRSTGYEASPLGAASDEIRKADTQAE